MKPLPQEVIADIRRTLDDVIRPALEDGYAREQALLMSNLLEHVRLRIVSEAELMREDYEDMLTTLAELSLPVPLTGLAELPAASAAADLDELRAQHEWLRGVLQEAVATVESAAMKGDESVLGSRDGLWALLRRQLDRERRMLGPGYTAGT